MTRRLHFFLVALLAGLLLLPAGASARSKKPLHKLDLALREAVDRRSGPQRVIVRAKPGMRALLREALQSHGDAVGSDHPMIDGFAAEVHGVDLEALADDPAVESVSLDAIVVAGGRRERLPKAASALNTLRATLGLSSNGPDGAGVGVAVIDSGIQPSRDFGWRISAFYDFTQNGAAMSVAPYDDYGHGTHVAGLIGGSGLLSDSRYRGVAPGVRLIGLKVLDKNGRGRTSDALSALEFATANRAALGVDVINLSLGHPIYESAASDPLVQAVERAVRAGIVVVASAGNFGVNPATGLPGYAGITSPGNAPSAITVGAVKAKDTVARSDDKVAAYSSRGPSWYDAYAKPDLVAPGDKLTSDAARNSTLYNQNHALWVRARGSGGTYMKLSGTSMAAGLVSGVAALVLEANRSASTTASPSSWLELTGAFSQSADDDRGRAPLSPNAVKAILQYTAVRMYDDLGSEYDSLTQGAGEINAAGALQLAGAIDAGAPQGSIWVTSAAIVPRNVIGEESLAWSQNIVWGNQLVRGSTVFVNQPAWATSTVWGSNVVWGASKSDNAVWGASDNIVWGESLLDNIVWGTLDLDNIVWGNVDLDNIVWGNNIVWASNVVWGNHLLGATSGQNIIWGAACDAANVVWGNLSEDNIVWGYGSVIAASMAPIASPSAGGL